MRANYPVRDECYDMYTGEWILPIAKSKLYKKVLTRNNRKYIFKVIFEVVEFISQSTGQCLESYCNLRGKDDMRKQCRLTCGLCNPNKCKVKKGICFLTCST